MDTEKYIIKLSEKNRAYVQANNSDNKCTKELIKKFDALNWTQKLNFPIFPYQD